MTRCHLICHSNSVHLSQIYAGFSLLQQDGTIALSQECRKRDFRRPERPQHLRDARHAHLTVVVDDALRLHYDVHDSYEIDQELADDADFYFKRSFDAATLPGRLNDKVFSLGLNYPLYPRDIDKFESQ